MASTAITVIEQPATIESDTSEAVITKHSISTSAPEPTGLPAMEGTLINHGPNDVWMKVSVVQGTAAASVVTTGAQAQLQVPLPAGGEFEWLPQYSSIAHKTASGTAVLSFRPKRRLE